MKKTIYILLIIWIIWLIDDRPMNIEDRIDYYSVGRFIYEGGLCSPNYYLNDSEYFVLPSLPLGMYLFYYTFKDNTTQYPRISFLDQEKEFYYNEKLNVTNVQKLYIAKDRIIAQNERGWYQITDQWPMAVQVEMIQEVPKGPFQKLILFKPVLWTVTSPNILSESYGSLKDTVKNDNPRIDCIEKITEYSIHVVKKGKFTQNHRVMGKTAESWFILDLGVGVPRWVDQETFEQEIQLALKETKRLEWKTSYYAEARENHLKGLTRNDSQAFEVIELEAATPALR